MKSSGVEWIREVPEDWDLKRLQVVLYEINRKNNPVQTINILSLLKDIGVVPYEDKGNQGNKSKTDLSDYKIAYPNTIVMNSMNVIIGSVGISDYYGCVSPVYYVFSAKDQANIKYINYIFQTREFQNELKKYANGILEIRLRLSSDDVLKRKVPMPSLKVQNAIVDELENRINLINKIIDKINNEINLLDNYKKSIITETVTKGLDRDVPMKDSGIEWIGEIPENWNVVPLKYLVIYNYETLSNDTDPDYLFDYLDISSVDSELGVTTLETMSFRDSPSRARRAVRPGDVVISTVRTYLKAITMIPNNDLPIIASTGFATLRSNGKINQNFLAYSVLAEYFISEIESKSNGVSYPAINASDLVNISIILPPLSEQEKIVTYIDKKVSKIINIKSDKIRQINKLEEYKKSLIYEYVTGKKEVGRG